jgi:hypothetical protein
MSQKIQKLANLVKFTLEKLKFPKLSQFLVKNNKSFQGFFLDHKLVIFPTMENGMLQPRFFEYNVLYVTMGDIQSSNWMIKNSHQNHKIYFYLKTLFM